MERCDFSSVITIIRNYISESREINQTDLLYDLFDAFTKEEQNKDYVFDNGLVCRWIKGIANISPQIIMYYTDDNNQKLQTNILMKQIVPTHTSTTAATQPEDLTSSRRFTRVMLPEPSSKKVLSPTAAQSTVK